MAGMRQMHTTLTYSLTLQSTPKHLLPNDLVSGEALGKMQGEGRVKQGWLKSVIPGSSGFQGNGWLCLTSLIITNGAFPWWL